MIRCAAEIVDGTYVPAAHFNVKQCAALRNNRDLSPCLAVNRESSTFPTRRVNGQWSQASHLAHRSDRSLMPDGSRKG